MEARKQSKQTQKDIYIFCENELYTAAIKILHYIVKESRNFETLKNLHCLSCFK